MSADSPEAAPAPPPTRAEIVRTALMALGGATAAVGVGVVVLAAAGQDDISEGLLLGHLLAQGVTASWLLGALLTFHLSWRAFMVGTVGAFPLRVLLLGGAIALFVTQFQVHLASMTFSLLGTMLYGFFVEGWTFNALAERSEAETAKRPDGDSS